MFNLINNAGSLTLTMPQWVWAILGVLFIGGLMAMFRRGGGIRH